ncbi:MAG: peptidylprolyl isomerase [Colwellia sp.]|nr:peptidylprolyl isomerase [Colwellia sp.]
MLNKLIKEPLIHFLIISLIIFFIYDATNTTQIDSYNVIISEGRIEQLTNEILSVKSRLPVAKEIDIAIESFALNEIYLREARELGLHQGDKIIERRLRQKMEYLLDEMASIQQPNKDELNRFYQDNIDRYKTPLTYSFTQIYISIDRSKKQLTQHLKTQQQLIAQGNSPRADPSMLPQQVSHQSSQQIEHTFGELFIVELDELAVNTWSHPIDSGLGKHLVFIKEKIAPMVKPLLSIKEDVTSDWQYEQRKIFKQVYEDELMRRYNIEIHLPKVVETSV